MQSLMRKILSYGVALGVFFSANAWAAFPTQFSANQTIHAAGQVVQGKMFADQGKMRLEQNMAGMEMVTIVRPDKGVAYQIMPGNMYMEVPLQSSAGLLPLGGLSAGEAGALPPENLVGTETLNGVECEKYKMNTGQSQEALMWVAKDTHLPVKMEMADGSSGAEWSNVVAGPQKPELFELPTGYTKIDAGAMMQGMMGSGATPGQTPVLPQGVNLPSGVKPTAPTN